MGADFLENLGKTITKTAEKVGKKAEEVVGVPVSYTHLDPVSLEGTSGFYCGRSGQ